MKVFDALVAELKGVFGKAYVFAGFLPAFVLVFVVMWFSGRQSASSLVADIATVSDESLGNLAMAAFTVAGIGLILFSSRGWILDFAQLVPGKRFLALKSWLVYRQLRSRAAAQLEHERQQHHKTIVELWIGPQDFKRPSYVPWFERVPPEEALVRESNNALKAFASRCLDGTRPPKAGELKRILNGLKLLFAYAKGHHGTPICASLIAQWRGALASEGAPFAVEALRDYVYRMWVDSGRARANFPRENKWVGPTRLGSRSAALDDYAQDRYGMDTSMLLSRLSGVLRDEVRQGLADSRLSVETLVNLSVVMLLVVVWVGAHALLAIVASLPTLEQLVIDARGFAFFGCALLGASLFYNGAVYAFGGLAEKTIRAVDLHRLELIEHLGLAVPADMAEERELWRQLHVFFYAGKAVTPSPPLQKPK